MGCRKSKHPKTDIVRKIAKKRGIKVKDVKLAKLAAKDLDGYPFYWGSTGIGKTEIVQKAAKKHGIKIKVLKHKVTR